MTPASDRRRLIYSNRSSNFSSLRRMESFMAANYSGHGEYSHRVLGSMPVAFGDQQPGNGLRQGRIRRFGGLAQGVRRRMQQPIRQCVGEIVDDLIGGFARSQQAPRLLDGLLADPVGLLPQRANGRARVVGPRFGEKSRDFLVDD